MITDVAPAHDDGSGAEPHQFRRDEIQKKPEAPVSNDKEEKLDGVVKSKVVEQSPEDPGNKKKVFLFVRFFFPLFANIAEPFCTDDGVSRKAFTEIIIISTSCCDYQNA